LFAFSRVPLGTVLIVFSYLFLLGVLSGFRVFRIPRETLLPALLLSAAAFVFYDFTKCPSFFWGRDPAFHLAVDAGAVVEPLWSPLSYLVAKSLCVLSLSGSSFLPSVSPLLLSFGVFLSASQWNFGNKKTPFYIWLLRLLAGLLAVGSLPLWSAGTLASGAVSGLGLTLFIWQRGLVKKETEAWSASCLISGLLFCVHPYWGLMGAVQLPPIVKKDWSHWPKNA